MDVKIYRKPCWLLEAAELVYSLVNEIPAENLTVEGPYCIPANEVERIRRIACASIDPTDRQVRFYFQGVPLESIPERLSCLGNCILYQDLLLQCSEPEDMVQQLAQSWNEEYRAGCSISRIGPFTLSVDRNPEHTFWSLSESIEKLPVPQAYQLRLIEVFTAYEMHLNRVYQLLLPVTQTLRELLVPWVQQATPLLDQWEAFFQTHSPQEFLQNRARAIVDEFDTLELTICYFFPNLCPSMTLRELRTVRCMMGVSKVPCLHMHVPKCPEEWELSALRLVMNPARLEMLRIMRDTPMAVQELAQKLNLNVGSVSRDVNNMRNARLLLVDDSTSRSFYRTNLMEIEKITKHVLEYLRQP